MDKDTHCSPPLQGNLVAKTQLLLPPVAQPRKRLWFRADNGVMVVWKVRAHLLLLLRVSLPLLTGLLEGPGEPEGVWLGWLRVIRVLGGCEGV